MKFLGKLLIMAAVLSLFTAVCTPASAESNEDSGSISLNIFAKDKNIQSGSKAYIVASATDENGQPIADQTVYFYQNVEISGVNVDQYIGEAVTNERGNAIFRPALSVNGDYGVILIGCATEDSETGQAFYSGHTMITVTNPYPYIETEEENQEQ